MSPQLSGELSDEELNRMERLVAATSAGPWISCIAGRDRHAQWNYVELGSCNELGSFVSFEMVGSSVADQDFVASARQDVPRLLHEVRSLRARIYSLLSDRERSPLKAMRGVVEAPLAQKGTPMWSECTD